MTAGYCELDSNVITKVCAVSGAAPRSFDLVTTWEEASITISLAVKVQALLRPPVMAAPSTIFFISGTCDLIHSEAF